MDSERSRSSSSGGVGRLGCRERPARLLRESGSIGKSQLKNIEQQAHEYNVTLTKIIPMDIEHGNDTVHEEISHLFTNRVWLHEQFASLGTNGKMAPFWQQVQELDKILIKQRWMILDHALDYYKYERQRLKMPKAYWWWYLDELESGGFPEWVMPEAKEVDVTAAF